MHHLQYSTAQHSTTQHSIALHSTAQCITVQHGPVVAEEHNSCEITHDGKHLILSRSYRQLLACGLCSLSTASITSKFVACSDLGEGLVFDARADCATHVWYACSHPRSVSDVQCANLQPMRVRSPGMGMPGFQPLGMLGILRPGGSCCANAEV